MSIIGIKNIFDEVVSSSSNQKVNDWALNKYNCVQSQLHQIAYEGEVTTLPLQFLQFCIQYSKPTEVETYGITVLKNVLNYLFDQNLIAPLKFHGKSGIIHFDLVGVDKESGVMVNTKSGLEVHLGPTLRKPEGWICPLENILHRKIFVIYMFPTIEITKNLMVMKKKLENI